MSGGEAERGQSQPLPGEVVAGRFRIEEELGAGGMGVVWRATQLNLGREVALKVLQPRLSADPRARLRFEREARVASALRHPGAVEIYDFGEDRGRSFLAMELLRGTTLRACLEPGAAPLALPRALSIAWQIADVLCAAHAIPLVHRDLKPENIFLEADDRVVVVDFGLAFIEQSEDLGRMTGEGVVAGTPAYSSPEQARGVRVGPPSDVYSLGCVLYELVAGVPPFEGEGAELASRHLYVPPEPPGARRRDVPIPAALEQIVLRMLRKRPDERPTAPVVRVALETIDPGAAEREERRRDGTPRVGRAARMITAAPGGLAAAAALPERLDGVDVAVVGPLDVELSLALSANGLLPYSVSEQQPIAGVAAIYAPGATLAELGPLLGHGVPLVTDADRGDMARVAALVERGVDEVVMRPVGAEDLVRQLSRAIRKRQRRAKP